MIRFSLLVLLSFVLIGCGKAPAPQADSPDPSASKTAEASSQTVSADDSEQSNAAARSTISKSPAIKPITLGAFGGGKTTGAKGDSSDPGDDKMNSVLDAMQPLQILLGDWSTSAFRKKGAGSANWVWDFKTDKSQPALVMSTQDHPYFTSARLTFSTEKQAYLLSAKDTEGGEHRYEGTFTEEPHLVAGNSGKLEQRFELKFSEAGNEDSRKLAGVSLTQREKDRVLMAVFRRGSDTPDDTIGNQREGTSIAASDTDYGDKECIVSQGLGVMTVTYQGRTFYVCCSGCQSAFNDDPTFWINKAEERKKSEEK